MTCADLYSYAFIHYSDEDVCRKAHDSSQELMYQNRTLVVMYGKKAGAVVNPVPKRQAPTNKRMLSSLPCSNLHETRIFTLNQFACF